MVIAHICQRLFDDIACINTINYTELLTYDYKFSLLHCIKITLIIFIFSFFLLIQKLLMKLLFIFFLRSSMTDSSALYDRH